MRVFVDVDTQNDFMNYDGALYVPGAEDIKSLLTLLTKYASDNDVTILKTKDHHMSECIEFISNGGIFPKHCMSGTEGASSIKETDIGSVLFHKDCYDVFDDELGNAEFKKYLEDNEVIEAVVYGVATDYCIKAAVLGIRKLGITTIVIKDAIAGVAEETTESAVKEMVDAGAMFLTLKEYVSVARGV